MALGTPVAGAAAYSAAGGTTVSPAYPTGILATDAVLLFVGQKPSTANSGTVTTPAGWTLRGSLTAAGGYGTTLGADTGNTNLRIYSWNTPIAGQTGNLAVTLGINNVSWAFIVRIPTGGGALSYLSHTGQQTTTPASRLDVSLGGGDIPNFNTGDMALWAMCIPTDVTTPAQFSAQTLTVNGTTISAAVEINEPDSTTGNDIGGYSAYATVTGPASGAIPSVGVTVAGTLTNVRGPVVLLRVREGAAAQTLTPTLYTNTQTFHNPTVTRGAVNLSPSLYTNNQTFYSADVTQGGATQTLTPSLYTNGQTFYAPTVAASNTLTPAKYDNAQTFYAATVSASNTLAPSLYTNTQTFYNATVSASNALTPALYTNTQTFYSATVNTSNALAPSLYSNTQTFYSAVITQTGGAQTLLPSLYTNDQTFYSATVAAGTVNLSPALYTNNQTFFAATVGTANELTPDLYTNQQAFFAANVSTSASLLPSLYSNAQTFYAPTVAIGAITLQPSLYTNTQDFYAPAITTTVDLAPALFTNTQAFYSATVSQGATTQDLIFEDYVVVDYVEPGYVTWAASFQGGNQFFSPTLEQFALLGEGWLKYPAKKTRSRSFRREREDRENLRATIERAINPIVATEAKVVTVGDKVAVLTKEGPSAAIPVPPAFDAKAVSIMVASMLEKAGVEAQRVRDAAAKRQAEALMESIRDEYRKRLIKKRREEELLLLA